MTFHDSSSRIAGQRKETLGPVKELNWTPNKIREAKERKAMAQRQVKHFIVVHLL